MKKNIDVELMDVHKPHGTILNDAELMQHMFGLNL